MFNCQCIACIVYYGANIFTKSYISVKLFFLSCFLTKLLSCLNSKALCFTFVLELNHIYKYCITYSLYLFTIISFIVHVWLQSCVYVYDFCNISLKFSVTSVYIIWIIHVNLYFTRIVRSIASVLHVTFNKLFWIFYSIIMTRIVLSLKSVLHCTTNKLIIRNCFIPFEMILQSIHLIC